MSAPLDTAPVLELTPQALDNLREQLREYRAIYSPLFQRREPREGAQKYLHGLLLELPRTSIEPMVLALEGPHVKAVRTMQLFLSADTLEYEALLHPQLHAVNRILGDGGRVPD